MISYDIERRVDRLKNKLKLAKDNNERKDSYEEDYRKAKSKEELAKKYIKAGRELLVFMRELNATMMENNLNYVQKEIDEIVAQFFPLDSFHSEISIKPVKDNYSAILKLGNRGREARPVVVQNGDFMQQLLKYSLHKVFNEVNKSKILFIDEGFSNSDESRNNGIIDLLTNTKVKYKIMIEHRADLVDNIEGANIINLQRDPITNKVRVL